MKHALDARGWGCTAWEGVLEAVERTRPRGRASGAVHAVVRITVCITGHITGQGRSARALESEAAGHASPRRRDPILEVDRSDTRSRSPDSSRGAFDRPSRNRRPSNRGFEEPRSSGLGSREPDSANRTAGPSTHAKHSGGTVPDSHRLPLLRALAELSAREAATLPNRGQPSDDRPSRNRMPAPPCAPSAAGPAL